jgi:hypothetical protein
MRIYSDSATKRLEDLARHMGVLCDIRKIEAHEEGRFFVVAVDGHPLKWPVALGFSDSQAEYSLKRRTWERYAVRGDAIYLPSSDASRQARSHAAKRRPRLW